MGTVVGTRYTGSDAAARQAGELACLRALAGVVPVPEVVDVRPGVLRTQKVPGVPGDALVDVGQGAHVLRLAGQVLRRLRDVDPTGLELPGAGPALVHGDFGPHRLLVDGERVTAVVGWADARRGDRLEDLAWAEWVVRMRHPDAVADLPALFAGYGGQPSWAARQEAMLARCARMAGSAPDPAQADMWRGRAEVTRGWSEAA